MHFLTQSFLFFLKHAHTILVYVAVSLYYPSLSLSLSLCLSLSLKSLLEHLSVILTPHIHLIILISAKCRLVVFLHWPRFTAM